MNRAIVSEVPRGFVSDSWTFLLLHAADKPGVKVHAMYTEVTGTKHSPVTAISLSVLD